MTKPFKPSVLFVLVFSLLPNFAWASSALWNKVNIQRDSQGNITALTIKSPISSASFSSYVQTFTQNSKALLAAPTTFSRLTASMALGTGSNDASLKSSALQSLQEMDFNSVEQQPAFRALVSQLSGGLAQAFLDQNTVASLSDSTFFYDATWRQDLLEWGLDAINSATIDNVGLNLITYLFNKAVDDLIERRAFYQNYTLHYLTTTSAAALGLTQADVDLILSSIYEARLEPYDLAGSLSAQADWSGYGVSSESSDANSCSAMLSNSASSFSSVGAQYDFLFYPVKVGNTSEVINVRDASAYGSGEPSLAIDESYPQEVMETRVAYELLLLGINIAPIPGLVQTAVNWYVHTQYEPQIGTEGALLAHYEMTGNTVYKQTVINQTVNPWILADKIQ